MSSPIEHVGRKKLVVFGDSCVGKSSLIDRFAGGVFDNKFFTSNEKSYSSKTIEIPEIGKSITLDIVDTAGQERFRSLARNTYRGASMVILVYDITKKESFVSIKNFWFKDIKEHGNLNIVIGIAGNKSDLHDRKAVSEEEARDFAESNGAVFGLTSVKDNTGIEELFKNIGRKYLELESDKQKQNQENKITPKKIKKKKIHCIII